MPRLLLLFVGMALSFSTAVAAAQDTLAQRSAAARALFAQGVELADQRRWSEAADRFRRAHALRASPTIAYNLAAALVHAGHPVEASELLRGVLRDPGADRAVRASSAALLERTEPDIGRLTLRVGGDSADVAIAIDGSAVAAAIIGIAAPIDPGDHEIVATRAGSVVATTRVHVEEGGSAEAELEIPPRPPEEIAPVQAEHGETRQEPTIPLQPPSGRERAEASGSVLGQWWFWSLVGVVLAGGAVAIVLATQPPAVHPSYTGNLGVLEVP